MPYQNRLICLVILALSLLAPWAGASGRLSPCEIRNVYCPLAAAVARLPDDDGAAESERPDRAGDMDAQGWIRFDGSNGHIEFPVRVNGATASAILDTGADATMISSRLARRAKIGLNRNERIRMIGIHGQREIPLSRDFTLEFAGRSVDLSRVPIAPGPGFGVVLGRGMFEWAVVQIDYPNQRIRFLDREVVEFESNVKTRTTRQGAPMIECRILGEKAWMLLDTGNGGPTVLKRKFVRRHELGHFEIPGISGIASGVITAVNLRLLQIPEFELGPYEFESLLAAHNAESNEGFDGRQRLHGSRLRTDRARFDGILGYEVLRNFLVTMDLEGRRIHLRVP